MIDLFTNSPALADDSHMPYYVQIKSFLREIISKMEPNTLIPGEKELAEKWGVSRGTAKQAIMDLVYEGLLYRKQGKGTFTANRISRSYDQLPSFSNDIRRSGHAMRSKALRLSSAAPAPRARRFFRLADGEEVIRYKRLVFQDDNPVAVVISYLNSHLYKGISLSDIGDSLYDTLRDQYGAVPTRAQDSYSIVEISPETAALLQCAEDAMVCYSERMAYLENGEPAEFVESYIRADRFRLEVNYNCEGDSFVQIFTG